MNYIYIYMKLYEYECMYITHTHTSRPRQSDTADLCKSGPVTLLTAHCSLRFNSLLDLSTAIAWEDIINTDGDNEETWEKFDEHFTKLPGKRATGDLESLLLKTTSGSRSNMHFTLRFLNMSWATNWDGMRYDIVFYGDPDALDFLDTAPNAVPLAHWQVFLATLATS